MSVACASSGARVRSARMRAGASPLAVAASTWTAVAASAACVRPSSPARRRAPRPRPAHRPAGPPRAPPSPRARGRASASSRRPSAAQHDAAVLVQRDAQLRRAAAGQVPLQLVERRERVRQLSPPCSGRPRGSRARPAGCRFGSSTRSARRRRARSSSTTGAPPNCATIGVTIEVARASGSAANGAYAVAARKADDSSRRAHSRASRLAVCVVRRLDERRVDEQRAQAARRRRRQAAATGSSSSARGA